jgi:hypothetical protein
MGLQLPLAGFAARIARAAVACLATLAVASPAAADDYVLQGPLRGRDMTPFHLSRLEMLPARSSSALGDRWSLEVDLAHTNTFAKSKAVDEYLVARGRRQAITRRDVEALLAIKGDVFYLDGEIGLLATTLHYKAGERLGFFLAWPAIYYTGGIFDTAIEGFHRSLGLGNADRQRVARNEFRMVYRIGREQVVQLAAPESGPSDPVLGVRYRLLPPASRWDLIVEAAVKVAVHSAGALSTGGSDLGLQLALHRVFGTQGRQAVFLDASEVHLGGALPDRRVDRNNVPALVTGYEIGLTRRTSAVAQLYVSPSVFRSIILGGVPQLIQTKFEILAGVRSQRGPLTWQLAIIENIFHLENTPDVGALLGVTWRLTGD